jgi:hypothetical protein
MKLFLLNCLLAMSLFLAFKRSNVDLNARIYVKILMLMLAIIMPPLSLS